MKEVTQHLDKGAEEALRTIIGKLYVGFYFPDAWIRVAGEGFEVGSLSIPTGKDNFVVITCNWGDTVEDYLDIHYLQVSVDDRPRDIAALADPFAVIGRILFKFAKGEVLDSTEARFRGGSKLITSPL